MFETGTCLEERLARGDEGVNPLDSACKEHDIEYQSTEAEDRYLADKKLEQAAMKRITAKGASVGERATAAGVVLAMKVKRALARRRSSRALNKNKNNNSNSKPRVKRTIVRRKASGSIKKRTTNNRASKSVASSILASLRPRTGRKKTVNRAAKHAKYVQKKKKRIIETPTSFPTSNTTRST